MHLINLLIAALTILVTSAAVLPKETDTAIESPSAPSKVVERHVPAFIAYSTPTHISGYAGEFKPRSDISTPPMSPARKLMLANGECHWTCVKFQCWCLEVNEPTPQNDKNFSEEILKDIQARISSGVEDQGKCGWSCFGFTCMWICHNANDSRVSNLADDNEANTVEARDLETIPSSNEGKCGWSCFGFTCMWICHNADDSRVSKPMDKINRIK